MDDTAGCSSNADPADDDVLARWARKIARLLEHAEATDGAEAEAFRGRALELMARYRIDAALIDASRQPAQRSRIVSVEVSIGRGPYQSPRQDLLGGLCRLHSCRMLYTTHWEGRRYELIGHQSDVDVVLTMWTSLLTQAVSAVAAEKIPGNANVQAWKRSFFAGFVQEAVGRLREAQRVASADADTRRQQVLPVEGDAADDRVAGAAAVTSMALVLKARSRSVDEFVAVKYPKLGRARRPAPVKRRTAYNAGRAAGQLADVGHGRVGSGAKAIGA